MIFSVYHTPKTPRSHQDSIQNSNIRPSSARIEEYRAVGLSNTAGSGSEPVLPKKTGHSETAFVAFTQPRSIGDICG